MYVVTAPLIQVCSLKGFSLNFTLHMPRHSHLDISHVTRGWLKTLLQQKVLCYVLIPMIYLKLCFNVQQYMGAELCQHSEVAVKSVGT
jgi:hypothetical protein